MVDKVEKETDEKGETNYITVEQNYDDQLENVDSVNPTQAKRLKQLDEAKSALKTAREEAEKALEKAKEVGDVEEVDKQNRRLVKVGKSHVEECKKLLGLMGVPYVQAPCEAEAQCAELVKAGKVYAVGTEDMDALTFGSKVLLRHLTMR